MRSNENILLDYNYNILYQCVFLFAKKKKKKKKTTARASSLRLEASVREKAFVFQETCEAGRPGGAWEVKEATERFPIEKI